MEAPACRAGHGWARKAEDGREDVGSCWEWGSAVGTCCLVARLEGKAPSGSRLRMRIYGGSALTLWVF